MRTVRGLNLYSPDGRKGRLQAVRVDWTNIHTWTEVYLPTVGWVEADPAHGLNAFAIPATADATGSASYGNDGFYHSKSAVRAAIRGGSFDFTANAGVFCLDVNNAPSVASHRIGFRACKAL